MQIIRRYKKLSWFDFVDIIDQQIASKPTRDIYFELMDELHWRLVESISEGASFKLKAQAQKILDHFENSGLDGIVDLRILAAKF